MIRQQLNDYFKLDGKFERYLHIVRQDKLPWHCWRNLLFLILYCAVSLCLTLVPLDLRTRLTLYDCMLFYLLPQDLNWIMLCYTLNAIYFQYFMYRPSKLVMHLLWKIIYQEGNAFFLEKQMFFFKQHRPTADVVKMLTKQALLTMRYFLVLKFTIHLFYHGSSLYQLYLDWEHFFTTAIGYLRLPIFVLCSWGTDLMTYTYGNLLMIYCVLGISFTAISFVQFGAVNRLLTRPQISNLTIHLFTQSHTRMLALIMVYNRFFGRLLFGFFVINVPQNAFELMGIILGQFPLPTAVIFANIMLGQSIFIIFFHVLSAEFSSKIHKCVKRLFHWSAQEQLAISLRAKLKIALYIDKFNTKKKYGITYGSVFGLMSPSSFFKFVLIYVETILYCYRLINTKQKDV